jgi:hypothetical protein
MTEEKRRELYERTVGGQMRKLSLEVWHLVYVIAGAWQDVAERRMDDLEDKQPWNS